MTNLSTVEVPSSPVVPTEGIPPEIISKVEAALPGEIISDTYPYPTKLSTRKYESDKAKLQIELLKMQKWVKEAGQRIVLIFEGRDAAGKGGTIQRFMEHLNPRGAILVALPAPSDRERGQWYFQRYVEHLPTKGEMVFFDRSWYNRAVVEPVMGFCTPAETLRFLRDTVMFEEMLINEGIQIFKFWFSVSREEQLRRVMSRAKDELKQWKVSDVDVRSLPRWDSYTEAKKAMFAATDTKASPWVVVKSDDKKRARLACMRYVLRSVGSENDVESRVAKPDPKLIGPAEKLYAKGEIW
ncbi:MAG: polyphosphate kinase 2 [Dehalococcoidia bacterium]|nr:polyphosphate kinase 2 [Dehalococcoidia bacterium]